MSPQPSMFGSPQGGKLQVMDPKKASNVEIVLKKFKMPSHCIADVRSSCPSIEPAVPGCSVLLCFMYAA